MSTHILAWNSVNDTHSPRHAGLIFAMGQNTLGQLGIEEYDTDFGFVRRPIQVPDITRVATIACGHEFTVCTTATNNAMSWGSNEYGQLGRRVPGGKDFTHRPGVVETGRRYACIASTTVVAAVATCMPPSLVIPRPTLVVSMPLRAERTIYYCWTSMGAYSLVAILRAGHSVPATRLQAYQVRNPLRESCTF